jgi:Meckel syndrome type 1 protein
MANLMNRPAFPILTLTLLLTAALSGCGSNAGYPSLARRPAERITGSSAVITPAPVPVVAEIPVDLAVQSKLARLREMASTAHARFNSAVPGATRLVSAAQGAAVASESWSVASIALATLESRRSDAMIALSELDSLYARERVDGGDGLTIATVRDQVAAWVADEDAALAQLRGRVTD